MVYASVDFLFVFLPAFLLAQIFLPYKNLTFVLFSLLFYFIGEGWYSYVVVLSVVTNYALGLLIDAQARSRRRKLAVGLGVALNLAPLLYFKYAEFFYTALLAASKWAWTAAFQVRLLHLYFKHTGFYSAAFSHAQKAAWDAPTHLPLGISFFTFHALSYLVDIYRGDAKAERSFVNLSLYILMFPQLIAGPILRFHTVADQLKRRMVTAKHVYYGMTLFCFGLGQKVLLADTMAGLVDPLFSRSGEMSSAASWLAAIAYAFQIYYDFAGYSNMAIGLGWITGFTFPQNFDFPYISRSITEFWRRWHMSLSRWFRDYLYIPLGGNRFGAYHTYRNLFIVFLLCGLWHGSAWTFVLWGCYQGLLLIIERIGFERSLRRLPVAAQHLYALVAILIGWVLFRSVGLPQAGSILARMFFLSPGPDGDLMAQLFGREQLVGLVFAFLFATPVVPHLLRRWVALPVHDAWPRRLPLSAYAGGGLCAAFIFAASAVKILTGAYSPFIYFRF